MQLNIPEENPTWVPHVVTIDCTYEFILKSSFAEQKLLLFRQSLQHFELNLYLLSAF